VIDVDSIPDPPERSATIDGLSWADLRGSQVFISPSRLFADVVAVEPPAAPRMVVRRAVVLGASIAGLMAARVLSDHADEVLIIERDAADAGGEPRAGVPQGTQVHGLLPAGQRQLERWFPGFFAEACAGGAVVPPVDRVQFWTDGVRHAHLPIVTDEAGVVSTRPFIEAIVRRRTLAIGNVRLLSGRADSIVVDGDRVVGARYEPAEEPGRTVVVDAEFVVDAMGRSSRLGDWLQDAGWPRPPMRRMPIRLNYATAMFARTQDDAPQVVVARSTAGPGRTARIGGINAVEGDRWMVLIAGYADDRPTRDTDDFLRRCRTDFPYVFGAVADTNPMIGSVVTYHQADSRRRDYHKLDRLPAGLVAAGDAVASFNPIYGQGMTSAVLHAACLSTFLRSSTPLAGPASAYFARIKVVVDAAWQVSTFADLALPHVDGPYPPAYTLINWISEMIFESSMTDARLNDRLGLVTTMLAHPSSLMRPGTLLRAARLQMFG
jgi:2-polyprenyl-6-methoxyphenol hydroxylase-like FAD-dependent oxidoreductase